MDERGCGFSFVGIHPHIERSIGFRGESAIRIVELHGGDTEVCEEEVGWGKSAFGVCFCEGGKVGSDELSDVGTESEVCDARGGFCELEWVGVEAQEFTMGLEAGEQFEGMATVAEGAVDGDFAGFWGENLEDFGHHDGAMGACGCFAAGEHFCEGGGVLTVFFVFLVKVPRVFAAVARTSSMDRRQGGIVLAHSWLYLRLEPRAFSTG